MNEWCLTPKRVKGKPGFEVAKVVPGRGSKPARKTTMGAHAGKVRDVLTAIMVHLEPGDLIRSPEGVAVYHTEHLLAPRSVKARA